MDGEGDGLKASQSPARKRKGGRQTEPTYYPTIAEKRKRGEEQDGKQAGGGFGRGRERVGMRLQDQTHQPPIIIGAKMWESKRGIGSWRRLDGWRPKETRRESRGAEKQRWRLFADEPSHRSLSLPFSHKQARRRTSSSPSSPAPLLTVRELVEEED